MFSSHRTLTLTCGHCGYVQAVRLRHTVLLTNGLATGLTAGAWAIGWALLAMRNARRNRKRCCAYCGEYLLAYSNAERVAANTRRVGEMASELSVSKPTGTTPIPESPPRPTSGTRSRRMPHQK